MGDWSILGGGQQHEKGGVDYSVTRLVDVQVGSPANTKGSYITMLAATQFNADGLAFSFGDANNARYLIDVAVGPVGSEQVIIPNLLYWRQSGTNTGGWASTPVFPVSTPVGSRIACRTQAQTTGVGARMATTLFCNDFLPSSPLGRISTYGANTATSNGTAVDAGGAANTKGAWTVITQASEAHCKYLIVSLGLDSSTSAAAGERWLVDVGVGGSGSEKIVIPDIYTQIVAVNIGAQFHGFPVFIPSGTRIVARAQCSTATAGNRELSVALYGVD